MTHEALYEAQIKRCVDLVLQRFSSPKLEDAVLVAKQILTEETLTEEERNCLTIFVANLNQFIEGDYKKYFSGKNVPRFDGQLTVFELERDHRPSSPFCTFHGHDALYKKRDFLLSHRGEKPQEGDLCR